MAAEDTPPRRTAVVTGASSGIGAATARRLAAEGYHVVCAARRTDRVQALAQEIGGTAVGCDVTSPADVAGLAGAVGPRLDVLVNNAGVALGSDPVAQADPDDWRVMYEVNVIGLLNVTKALLPALDRQRGRGDRQPRLHGRPHRLRGRRGVHRRQARHPGRHRDAAAGALRPPVRVTEIAPGMVRTEEFSLRRFGGDEEKAARSMRGWPSRSSPTTSPTRSPGSSPGRRT